MSSRSLVTRDTLLLAALLFVGVVAPGLSRWWLGTLGYDTLGMAVFALGYASIVFVVWYGWVRPLDIVGPSER